MNSDTYEIDLLKFDLYERAVDNLFDRRHPDEIKKFMVQMLHYIGLAGEVGELGEKIKKGIRDKGGLEKRDETFAKELGDIEWYLTQSERDAGYTKNEILQMNIDKLTKRLDQNKLHGDGDDR